MTAKDQDTKSFDVRSIIFGRSGRRALVIATLLTLMLLSGMLIARYVHHSEQENEMVAAGFHFSSAVLKETAPSQTFLKGGIFDVDIRNYEVENTSNISGMKGNGVTTQMDTTYTVEVMNLGSGDIIVSEGSADHKAVTTEETTEEEGIRVTNTVTVSGETNTDTGAYEYTLPGNGMDRIEHTVTIGDTTGSSDTAGDYTGWSELVPVSGETNLAVTIASTSHYIKSLTANYRIKGIEVSTEDKGGGISALIIRTNQYEGPLELTWSGNTFPAAGVNEFDYGWTVQYSTNPNLTGGHRQKATRTAAKETTYYFEYNGSTADVDPEVSGTWAEYDAESESWSGGAVISAGDN